MLKNEILTTKEELGLVAKKVFFEAPEDSFYERANIRVDKNLKEFLEKNDTRAPYNKIFKIPDSSTLNNQLIVRVEEMVDKGSYCECEILVQFMEKKVNFKDVMDLEKEIKSKTKDMTDLEKAEFINDYLCENIAYDKSQRSWNPFMTIMSGLGTCTAYSWLFQILGEGAGLKVGSMRSKNMAHRWNFFEIGEETYYIDVTFNATNNKSKRLFFQPSPIHLERGTDQEIAVPITDQ